MTRVAVATSSACAAGAARELAEAGGNAVDCALATAIMATNIEPGVCALAGGAYITVWTADDDPVTIDGNHAVPGAGLPEHERGGGTTPVALDYGGGVTTIVGPGSVAIPGALAAFDEASRRYGRLAWHELFGPAVDATRHGFPLSGSCHYYLGYSGELIFGRSEDGYRALHDADGKLLAKGSPVRVPHLADTLQHIADGGARVFYEGDVAKAIADHVRGGDGALTRRDLAEYGAVVRPSMLARLHDWQIATNPPPSVGGTVLTAMLLALRDLDASGWDRAALDRLIRVQTACLDYRRRELDVADDVGNVAAELVRAAESGGLAGLRPSSSTIHVSAVDDEGAGCAITASAGYGSGEMPEGTGLWLNNGLGEIELNRRAVSTRAPGTRLPSNMAPTVARCDDAVLAIGSPGADRITTAIHQVLANVLQLGMPLGDAIRHPRLHVDTTGASDRLTVEPGLDLPPVDVPVEAFPEISMYFGGVGAARYGEHVGLDAAADPRREGSVFVSGA